MTERIASGEIYIEVNDRDAVGRLNAVRSEYQRTMDAIDREEATATIDADTSKFDRKIKEASAKVDKFADEEAEVDLKANLKPLNRALAKANKELDDFEQKEPQANLGAKSARLKDELRIARAALKKFGTEEAQAKITAGNKGFIKKYEETQALVKRLDAESATVEVKLKGYEALRKHIADIEKDISDLNKRAIKAGNDRAQAEEALANAQKAREDALLAHSRKVEDAREKAARDRVAASEKLADRETKFEDQQMAKRTARLKRESKLRDDVHRARERTSKGRAAAELDIENNRVFALQGQYGNLLRSLERLSEARAKAGKSAKAQQALDEREIRIKERLGQVGRRLDTIEKIRSDRRKADETNQRELAEVPALEAAYQKLNNRVEELNKKRRVATRNRDQRLVYTIDLEARKVLSDIDKLGNELRRRTGKDPIIFNAQPRLSTRAGERIRRDFVDTWQRGNWGSRASGAIMSPIISSIRGPIEEAADRAGSLYNRRLRRAVNGGRGLRGNAADFGGAIGGVSMRVLDSIQRFGNGMAQATVRIGPFTMTLRKALGAIALLSPVVIDVVGALGALVGVVGSAAVGVGAVATAIVAGGVPAMLGMGLVVKDVAQEFTKVKAATKAYNDALDKGNYKLAGKKLKELHNVLGNVSDETARQVASAQKLGGAWDKATKPGRASVWKAAGEGIKAAGDLMPMFAKRTNESLHQTERGITGWMRALSSSTGKAVLSMNMDNFNRSIAATMRGLGNLVAYLGKVGAVAGRSLPGLAMNFNRWTKSMNDGTKDVPKFVGGIHGVINSMKAVGRTTMATGRFLKAFFGAGVRDGQSFADTMTNKLTDWTTKINRNPEGLQDFFRESVEGAKSLYNFLAPIGATFVGWARALSPIARAFFDGAASVGRFVQAIAEATALQGPLQALAVTLGTLWAFGKIGAAATAIRGFLSALFGIKAAAAGGTAAVNAQAAAVNRLTAANARAATSSRAAAGASAAALLASRGAARAPRNGTFVGPAGQARRMPRQSTLRSPVPPVIVPPAANRGVQALSKAGSAASRAVTGLGAAVLGTTGLMGGLVVLAAGAGLAYYAYANRTKETEKATKRMNAAFKASGNASATLTDGNIQLAGSTIQVRQSALDLANTQKQSRAELREMGRLTRANRKDSQAYRDVEEQHKQTLLAQSSARLNDQSIRRQNTKLAKDEQAAIKATTVEASKGQQAAMDRSAAFAEGNVKELNNYRDLQKAARDTGLSIEKLAQLRGQKDDLTAGREYEKLLREQGNAAAYFKSQQEKSILGSANLKRAMQGLGPIAERHAKNFASLGAKIQSALTSSKRPASYADPAKAAGVSNAAARAKTSGVSEKKIIDIIVNSKSAESAIRKLNQQTIKAKLMDVKVNNADQALSAIARLDDKKLNAKVVQIMAEAGSAESKISALTALGIPPKMARILGDASGALRALAVANGMTVKELKAAITRYLSNPGFTGGPVPSVTQSVIRRVTTQNVGSGGRRAGYNSHAAGSINLGTGVETKATRNAMDRAIDKVGRGQAPSMSTTQAQQGRRFQGVRTIVGEESQYSETVISENPAYRKSNIEALKEAARALGVQMRPGGDKKGKFKSGRAANKQERTAAGKSAEKRITSAKAGGNKKTKEKPHNWSSPSAEAQLKAVDQGFKDKDQKEFDIQRAEGKLKEPDTFTKVIGTDALGNDLVAVDQDKVNNWTSALMDISKMYQELVAMLQNIQQVLIPKARDAVQTAKKTAGENIGPLKSAIKREDDIIKGKRVKNVAKDEARARKAVYDRELKENQDMFGRANDDLSGLRDQDSTLKNEITTAGDQRDEYKAEADAVAGQASSAATSDSKAYNDNKFHQDRGTGDYAPGEQYGPPLPPTTAENMSNRLGDLDLESQLADVGQGMKGQPIRTKDAINADRKTVGQGMIDRGNALLSDTDATNDDEGRSLLGQGVGVLADLASNVSSSSPSSIQAAFDSASAMQKDLYAQFGSNIISKGGTIADMMRGGKSNVMRGGEAGGSQAGGGATQVYLQPTFKTQPSDPHLWSRDVAFELQAAL